MQFTESNPYVLRLLEALAGQGPALALLRGGGGEVSIMPQTQLRLKSLSGVTCIPRGCHVREQAEYGIANLIALKIKPIRTI